MGIVEKFIKEGQLTREEYPELLHLYQDPDSVRLLREEAVRIQKKYFGNKIYTRGLIEFTNYCRNDCYYCGIRRSNKNVSRYRLTKEEILNRIKEGGHLCCREEKIHGLMMIEWWTSSSPSDRDIRTVPLHCLLGRNQKKVIRSLKKQH